MTNGKPEQQKKDSADATDGRLRATDSEKHSTKLLIDHHAGQPTKTTVPNDARGATTRTEVHSTHAGEDRQRNPRGRRFADSPYPFQKKEKTGLQIEGKTPSLPPSDGPIMRERRAGWKTRPDFTAKQENDTDNKD